MTIYDLKPAFQNLLRPTVKALALAGVSANQVTVAAALLSAAVGVAVWLTDAAPRALLLVPPCLFIRMALNAIDGMLAREHHMKTPIGALLNELGDVASDAVLYLPFVKVPGLSPEIIVIVVLLSALTEMAGVTAVQIGASRRYDGPSGKSDRAFLFGLLGLLLGLGVPAGLWMNWVLGAAALLLALTVLNRCRNALREIGR